MPRQRFGEAPGEIDSCSLALALRRREEARLRLEQIARERAEQRAAFIARIRAMWKREENDSTRESA